MQTEDENDQVITKTEDRQQGEDIRVLRQNPQNLMTRGEITDYKSRISN